MNAGETWNGRASNVEYGMGTRAAGAMTLRAGAIIAEEKQDLPLRFRGLIWQRDGMHARCEPFAERAERVHQG